MPKAVRSVGSESSPGDIAEVLKQDGCVVIADLAPAETMDQIRAEVEPHLAVTGGGNTEFLGATTRRTGALIARSPTARSLITNPTIIDALDLVLGDHASTFQIDLTQLVTIGPGEPAQMIHRDQWSFDRYQFPRGFEAEVATMWAVTDFTEESGATRMVVGSHLLGGRSRRRGPCAVVPSGHDQGFGLCCTPARYFTAAAPIPPRPAGSG